MVFLISEFFGLSTEKKKDWIVLSVYLVHEIGSNIPTIYGPCNMEKPGLSVSH